MNSATRGLLLTIGLSPVGVIFGFCGGAWVLSGPYGAFLGLFMLFVPLAALVFVPGMIYGAAKIPLGVALAASLLIIPALILQKQPDLYPLDPQEWGILMYIFSACLGWIFVGIFVIQWRWRVSENPAVMVVAIIALAAGAIIGAVSQVVSPYHPVEGDIPIFSIPQMAMALSFLLGVALWCWQVIAVSAAMKIQVE